MSRRFHTGQGVVLPGETLIWDAGKGLKAGDERSVMFTARRVLD
jgi:hypothetical protein